MIRNRILITVIASTFLLQCKETSEKLAGDTPQKSERDAYYERIPDAPIDLYCHLDNLIDQEARRNICLNVLSNQNRNLSLDLGLVIKDNKLDTVEIQAFYFDENGRPKKDTVAANVLIPILNRMELSEIQILSHIQNADFAARVQWERFCTGHVQISKPGIQSAIDSIARKN